jgi:outer membrane protein TolC
MTQDQVDQQMQRIMNAEANGEIRQAEFEAHLNAIREALGEDPTDRALRLIAEALN